MTITGYKELHDKLAAMGAAAGGKALRSAALQSMLPVLRAAQANAPVGNPPYNGKDPYPVKDWKGRYRTPGYLKRNIIRRAYLSRDRKMARVYVGPKNSAFYGTQFLELGTSKIPKRPWLEPALRANLSAVDERLKAALKKNIDKAAKR